MISPIDSCSIASLSAPPAEKLDIILTEEDVLAETKSEYPGRLKGELFWYEHVDIAALNGRLEFLNKLTDEIHRTIPIKETPIAIISLGSCGLLTEFYLHQQLQRAGYQDISWRFIDTAYEECSHAVFRQFKAEATSNYKIFTTEQAYFNKIICGESLVKKDITRGEIIILAVNPPTSIYLPEFSVEEKKVKLKLHGASIVECGKANSIYLLINDIGRKDDLSKQFAVLASGEDVYSTGLKCYIDNRGQPVFDHNAYDPHSIITKTITEILNSPTTISGSSTRKITLADLDKRLDKLIGDLRLKNLYGVKKFVSNYDVSLSKLRDFFANKPKPPLFASFKNNQINIEISGSL